MKSARKKGERSGLDIIEEAAHALRSAGAPVLMLYYIGAIPFVLGFLYFCTDMSRNPFASQHAAGWAFGLALLYLWMKHWQALFALRLRKRIAREEAPAMKWRGHLRVFLSQAILQPSGLVVVPLSLIPLGLPLPWTFAFYQNVSAMADPESGDVSRVFKRASRQASLAPLQNHIALSLLALFGMCVFLNCCIAALALPGLVKMLFGIETVFTRSVFAMVNSTFFLAMAGVTYLCVDPIFKALYTLRCFYGESRESGEDIKAELRRWQAPKVKLDRAAALAALLILLGTAVDASAQPAGPEAAPVVQAKQPVPAPELDRAINDVIQDRKYAWRMPRERTVVEGEPGVIARFFNSVGRAIRGAVRSVFEFIDWLARKLFGRGPRGGGSGASTTVFTVQQVLLFLLVAAALIALALFLMRQFRRRRHAETAVAAQAVQPAPDLTDENVAADQLPEDGWTRLARELLERGEFRLALRAFYLATLAHLADRNLIRIAQFKSNRDYVNELQRRAHAFPSLLPMFGSNLEVFERIWYGTHAVNRDVVLEFAANVERMRTP